MSKPTDEDLEKALADVKEGRVRVRDGDGSMKRIMPPPTEEAQEKKPKTRRSDADFLGVQD
jgi:hypothetical protein